MLLFDSAGSGSVAYGAVRTAAAKTAEVSTLRLDRLSDVAVALNEHTAGAARVRSASPAASGEKASADAASTHTMPTALLIIFSFFCCAVEAALYLHTFKIYFVKSHVAMTEPWFFFNPQSGKKNHCSARGGTARPQQQAMFPFW